MSLVGKCQWRVQPLLTCFPFPPMRVLAAIGMIVLRNLLYTGDAATGEYCFNLLVSCCLIFSLLDVLHTVLSAPSSCVCHWKCLKSDKYLNFATVSSGSGKSQEDLLRKFPPMRIFLSQVPLLLLVNSSANQTEKALGPAS